jgi:hypothetical protein
VYLLSRVFAIRVKRGGKKKNVLFFFFFFFLFFVCGEVDFPPSTKSPPLLYSKKENSNITESSEKRYKKTNQSFLHDRQHKIQIKKKNYAKVSQEKTKKPYKADAVQSKLKKKQNAKNKKADANGGGVMGCGVGSLTDPRGSVGRRPPAVRPGQNARQAGEVRTAAWSLPPFVKKGGGPCPRGLI